MVTTLYLIRHGETEGGAAKRYYGSIDVPLSEKGIEQMRRTSAFIERLLRTSSYSRRFSYLREVDKPKKRKLDSGLKGKDSESEDVESSRLSAVYCSDLGRAVKSAEIIAESHGLKAVTVHGLRERSFGIWEGMTFTEIKERYPTDFDLWADDPVKHSPVNGETTTEVRDRVIAAMEGILNGHAGESVAVVAHGGVNRIILCHILGIPLENIFRVEQDHGSVNIIEFWNRYPVAKLINFKPD